MLSSISCTAVGVPHKELPGAVGLTTQDLNRLVTDLACRSRRLACRTRKIRIEEGDLADRDRPDDLALQARVRAEQYGQYVTNPVTSDDYVARPRHEAGLGCVQRDDRLEGAGVEVLGELTRPILRGIR